MRFLLLLLFLSLAAIPAAEAKGKKSVPVSTELRIKNRFEMGFRPTDPKSMGRLHGLGAIDTGGGSGRNTIIGIERFKQKTVPKKSRPKNKSKAPEVLGPNDKCFAE